VTVQDNTIVPGLAGVPAAESSVSYIDGQKGILEYRGYPIAMLGEHSTFEEVSWLVLYGELPTQAELDGFRAKLAAACHLPEGILETVRTLPVDGHPMEALQGLTALLGMDARSRDAMDAEFREESIVRLIATLPLLVAAFERHRAGKPYVAPKPELGVAGNFLWMLNEEEPAEIAARTLDVALILHADHTMNASTFAARVIASTEANPYAVVSGALGSLSGPLHGGANERVLAALRQIGGADNVDSWFADAMANKRKVMGFGHRVYKVKDPRAHALQALVRQVFAELGTTPSYDTALALEKAVVAEYGEKGIHPNVDFFSGIVYEKLGIPIDCFTPVFAIARVSGWLAHWREQMADNKLFRPAQVFRGVRERNYVPIGERG
jgi:citrate synthase